jgi:hypothetical protein
MLGALCVAVAAEAGAALFAGTLSEPMGYSAVPVALSIAFFIGFALGLNASRIARNSGLVLCGAPVIITIAKVVADTSRDPTSHNLWPFEVLFAAALGLIPGAGLLAGFIVRKALRPLPPWVVWIAACVPVAVAMMSPWLLRSRERNDQSDVIRTLRNLQQAEMSFAASNPPHAYTCDGPLLPGFEHAAWFSLMQGVPPRNWLRNGPYAITLRCTFGLPVRHFNIVADPRRGPTGDDLICIDEAGVIHTAPGKNASSDCGT